ncbi:golgin candidate 2-like [Bidens hawaiensis]|uniref:golgin candidate 2-like n=1 Tax=Bidens hawaiensis TaxID=980011 RepID=UPI004049233E
MSGWISSKLKVAETLLQQIDPPNPLAKTSHRHRHPPMMISITLLLLNVNPSSTLTTDADWTQLLSAPTNPINRLSAKRQLPNFLAKPIVNNKRSDDKVVTTDVVGVRGVAVESVTSEMEVKDATDRYRRPMPSADRPDLNQVKNDQPMSDTTVLPAMPSSSNKTESLSASDGEMNLESDSDSSSDSDSDSESERERERGREERRKRREKLLAEKAAAKAIEAIKDRENIVARLEGEKQSLEKIIDERAKQQAHEASQLQMTMMETMEAVDLEKQKHNNTRMEALMKLAKLETTNAELAKSLAAAQWSLEEEVKRVADLHRQIELKEGSREELTSKKKSDQSGNKLTASRGVEFKHEIMEAEHTFVTDKVGKLQEKAKTLETAIQETRKEIENPSEVEVELKRRLSQLTDHLIQKQAQVEALSSEKAMLMFRIEAVSRSLDESMSINQSIIPSKIPPTAKL